MRERHMPTQPKRDKPPVKRARDLRGSASKRGYDRTWQRLQSLVLSDEPLCRMCGLRGLVVAATLVDHIVPLNGGGERLTMHNLQPLCVSCHAKKTAQDGSRRPVHGN